MFDHVDDLLAIEEHNFTSDLLAKKIKKYIKNYSNHKYILITNHKDKLNPILLHIPHLAI